MIPPSGAQIIEYWARPTARLGGSVTSAAARAAPASGPSTNSSPMCDRSNRPARSRTARCSSRIEPYWTGISQPLNSISRAPSARCAIGERGQVDRRVDRVGHEAPRRRPVDAGCRAGAGHELGGSATRARSVSKVSSAAGVGERDPADLVELVVVARRGRRRSGSIRK